MRGTAGRRRVTAGAWCALVLAAAAGCGGGQAGLAGAVEMDGSGSLYLLTEAVVDAFLDETGGRIAVSVGISNTGDGLVRLCEEETDIAAASRTMNDEERDLCLIHRVTGLELPVAYDAVTVVVHPDNAFATCLTTVELRRLWEPGSRVRLWSDLRDEWPAEPIRLYGPGPGSGTFDFLTERVVGAPGAVREDYLVIEDDFSLVEGVSGDPYALGYFGHAFYVYHRNRVRGVAVDAGTGCIAPGAATIEQQRYALTRPLYLYVNERMLRRQPGVLEFLRFFMERAPELARDAGYVPLDASQYAIHLSRLERAAGG